MITLSGGTTSLAVSLAEYHAAWKAFLVVHHLDGLERQAVATTLSWKVADKAALYDNLRAMDAQVEQLHIGTVNDRFIASAALHEPFESMYLVKILERRPNSSDRLGLDSVDYLAKDTNQTFEALKAAGAHVEKERNDMHDWLSLRFGKNLEYEAKFTDHLLLDVAIKELELAKLRIENAL